MAQGAVKPLSKALQTAIAKIKYELFLFIIVMAIIIALTAAYAPNIVIHVTALAISGIVAYVALNLLKEKQPPPRLPDETGKLRPAYTEILYYNVGGTDAASDNRQEIEKLLADETTKSGNIKILINTGAPIFADPNSFLYNALKSKSPELIKVLLLDPDAKRIMSQRAREIHYTYSKYKGEILTSIDFCKRRNIDCRLYNFLSPWRLFIFDDKRIYVQLYLSQKSGDTSPIYGYEVTGNFSVGASFLQYFDSIYSISRVPH